MMTLEEYLRTNSTLSDHCLTVKNNPLDKSQVLECLIHPLNESGDTVDFLIRGNEILMHEPLTEETISIEPIKKQE